VTAPWDREGKLIRDAHEALSNGDRRTALRLGAKLAKIAEQRERVAMSAAPTLTAMYGLFQCSFCRNATEDDGHEHDGECGSREWPDELPPLWYGDEADEWWTSCRCCGRRGELVTPLVPLA